MELYSAIQGRRSVRQFKPDPVPKPLIEKILEFAMWSPSGMNQQNWYFVVVSGELLKKLKEISKQAFEKHIKATVSLVFNNNSKILESTKNFFYTLGNAPVVICAYRTNTPEGKLTDIQSVAAAIQNLLLSAHAEGLGACWMTGPVHLKDEINKLLNVEGRELQAVIPLGYPVSASPVPKRKEEKVKWFY